MPAITMDKTLLLSLALRIDGKLNVSLLVPLNAYIEMYENIVVISHQTNEPDLLIQSIDTKIIVIGDNFPLSDSISIDRTYIPLWCIFTD